MSKGINHSVRGEGGSTNNNTQCNFFVILNNETIQTKNSINWPFPGPPPPGSPSGWDEVGMRAGLHKIISSVISFEMFSQRA